MPHLPLFATPVSMYDLPGMDEINRDLTTRLVFDYLRMTKNSAPVTCSS